MKNAFFLFLLIMVLCEACNHSYKNLQGLTAHRKKCKQTHKNSTQIVQNSAKVLSVRQREHRNKGIRASQDQDAEPVFYFKFIHNFL